jgi:hypothetical protein
MFDTAKVNNKFETTKYYYLKESEKPHHPLSGLHCRIASHWGLVLT